MTTLPILENLAPSATPSQVSLVTPAHVADAISQLMTGALTPAQGEALLAGLHRHGLESRADVLRAASAAMRAHGASPDVDELRAAMQQRSRVEGTYTGGLVS